MTNLTTQQIRSTFIDYFKSNGHTHVPSSALVPHNDPSLMFVNSGMVQFKDVFTGIETRAYNKAVSSQKSVRAGGKHNDLDNVGYTARHHTFFEMLGNFSFGDYFKEEAIYYTWELLTKNLGLDKDKLYMTVYHDDETSAKLWKKIASISDNRIIPIATNDNFWSMGDLGPCGPCSEVFYDHGEHVLGGLPGTTEEDGDRFIEIWNLVFMQFEQVTKDKRISLPKPCVDTGMGLERISAVIQNVHDNYDTDIFQDIIGYTESLLKVKASGDELFSYRIIADHLRSSSFLIADGVMPSNEGRGYVLRRIMRRAMRHAHQLGSKEPLMYRLLPKLVSIFGDAFPELERAKELISTTLKQEEERFNSTLDRGLKLLGENVANISQGNKLSGDIAFKLYDTYGFPLDLTQDILRKKKIEVDIAGFDKNMSMQKERARKSWVGSGEVKTDTIWFDVVSTTGATEFLGYSLSFAEGKILKLVQDGKIVDQVSQEGAKFTLIANQTPFYGESGGQMGDIGEIISSYSKVKVVDTQKYLGKLIVHICKLESGVVSVNDDIKLCIDGHYRQCLKIHHSATHILHAVLREVLGNHITQKGSLVAKDKLRFDISHPKSLTREEIKIIEEKVNIIIRNNSKVNTNLMSTQEAIESGAMALFGEKYDSEVRVVSLGADTNDSKPYSFELCGGTHIDRTGDIGVFKIIGETAIAAGVRRIEAVCGEFALRAASDNEDFLSEIMDVLKSSKFELMQKIDALINSKKDLEKQLEKLQLEQLMLSSDQIDKHSFLLSGAKLLYRQFDSAINPKAMRIAAENLSKKYGDLVIVYVAKSNSKISIIVATSREVSDKYNAGKIAKEVSQFIDGSGGGQATLAQAGGSNLSKLSELESYLQNNLFSK